MGGGKRIRLKLSKGKWAVLTLLMVVVVFFTACTDNTHTGDDILINSLNGLVEQLQLKVEEFSWQQQQNKVDIEKNARSIKDLSQALERNSELVDSLYASMTYALIFSQGIDLQQREVVPTMAEIERLIEDETRKTLENFEKTYVSTRTYEPTDGENERLQKEITLLKE